MLGKSFDTLEMPSFFSTSLSSNKTASDNRHFFTWSESPGLTVLILLLVSCIMLSVIILKV